MADDLLDSSFPRPNTPMTMIEQYLRSIRTAPAQTPAFSGSIPGLDSVDSVPVEKSIIEKIVEATITAREGIAAGRPSLPLQRVWIARVRSALLPLVGKKSRLLSMLMEWQVEASKTPIPPAEFMERIEQVESLLRTFIESEVSGSILPTSYPSHYPSTKNIFIIHGHDELNLRRLSSLITDDFKLTPETLLDKPGQSATTIDKFERCAERCSYAIALFTKDDFVRSKTGEEYWQARPNVIFETGWFVGRLGKKRVLILLQDGVKIYSDFDGVNRIQFASDVAEGYRKIQAELQVSKLI